VVLAPFQPLFSIAEVDNEGLLSSFEYKPVIHDKFISCGIYLFNKAIIPFLPEKGSIERTVFVELTKKRQAAAYLMGKDEWWATVNNMKELTKAEEFVKKAGLDY
jgi:NDP-sugar pyrophosphorylase family protein